MSPAPWKSLQSCVLQRLWEEDAGNRQGIPKGKKPQGVWSKGETETQDNREFLCPVPPVAQGSLCSVCQETDKRRKI